MYFRLTAAEGETVVIQVRPPANRSDSYQEEKARAGAIRYFHRCWKWLVGDGAVVQRVACFGESTRPFGERSYRPFGGAWYASNGKRVRDEPTVVGHVAEDRLDFPR